MDTHDLTFTQKPSEGGPARALALKYSLRKGFAFSAFDSWTTDTGNLDALETTYRFHNRAVGDWTAFIERERSAASLSLESGNANVSLAGVSEHEIDLLLADIRAALPRMVVGDEGRVPVTFWSLSPHGPRSVTRKIEVPTWPAIEGNYTMAVRGGLGGLLGEEFQPAFAGQLILWHGDPGTGKTWALRALASEWRSWCALHYITDPEEFFGRQAHYMLEVLLSSDLTEHSTYSTGTPERWRLLVLEDTGELLSADAKERSGQGLSRLLNVVDGLIGQGLRILVLVTTNEKIRNLHPAVARAGRCAALVEFQAFDRSEAREWLEARGVSAGPLNGSYPVSDLYALVNGWRQGGASHLRVGFGGEGSA